MGEVDLINRIDKASFIRNRDSFIVEYNKDRDILFLQIPNPPPAISVDYKGIFWLRVNPVNGEIVGAEIEGYRKVFLKRYHELEHMKPTANKPFVDRLSSELVGCLS